MNESVSPPVNSFFVGNDLGSIHVDPCSPNIYQQYVYGNTPFELPQIYAGDEVISYMVPDSSDNRFLILYPNNGNIGMDGILGRKTEPCTQNAECQTDIEDTCTENNSETSSEATKNQHPGFILLSVKHEKVRDTTPLRKVSSNLKIPGAPSRKVSRKRLRKVTPNPGALLVDGVGFISAEDASKLTSNISAQPSSFSRFRVTRIADASSWWIPGNSTMNMSVHDLKTSSLPDYVTSQYQDMQSDVSYTTQDRTKWSRDLRKYMGTEYLTKISEANH